MRRVYLTLIDETTVAFARVTPRLDPSIAGSAICRLCRTKGPRRHGRLSVWIYVVPSDAFDKIATHLKTLNLPRELRHVGQASLESLPSDATVEMEGYINNAILEPNQAFSEKCCIRGSTLCGITFCKLDAVPRGSIAFSNLLLLPLILVGASLKDSLYSHHFTTKQRRVSKNVPSTVRTMFFVEGKLPFGFFAASTFSFLFCLPDRLFQGRCNFFQ